MKSSVVGNGAQKHSFLTWAIDDSVVNFTSRPL